MHWKLSFLWLICWSIVHASKAPSYDLKLDGGRQGSYPVVPKFMTSKARAPIINFREWNAVCDDDSYYFITPRGWKVKDPGPMIVDSTGTLVWSKHFANKYGGQAYDFKVQPYRGEQYLTFWLGDDTRRGHGFGHYYMMNASYDVVHKVGKSNGHAATLPTDLHDFVITAQDTALVTVYTPKQFDIRSFGRKWNDVWNQAVWDCSFQEIDLETGEVTFNWEALAHVNTSATYSTLASSGDAGTRTAPFDWFHINSVQKDELGNFLVSARNTHAVYYVDARTEEVLWTLGGKQNSFQDLSDGRALNFAWQHDARFVPMDAFPELYTPPSKHEGVTTRLMTLFDNAAMDWDYTFGTPYSRALLLELSYPTTRSTHNAKPVKGNMGTFDAQKGSVTKGLSEQDRAKVSAINATDSTYTVRVVREYINQQHVRSGTQGNVQILPHTPGKDSHVLAGYGLNAVITTFSSNGSVLCDAHFGASTSWKNGNVQSYRAFKFPWSGRPGYPPSVALRWGNVYVSWNGATDVSYWALQASHDGVSDWREITRVPKESFETVIAIDMPDRRTREKYVRVIALDGEHRPLDNGVCNVLHRGYSDTLRVKVEDAQEHLLLSVSLMLAGCVSLLWLLRKLSRSLHKRRLHKKAGRQNDARLD